MASDEVVAHAFLAAFHGCLHASVSDIDKFYAEDSCVLTVVHPSPPTTPNDGSESHAAHSTQSTQIYSDRESIEAFWSSLGVTENDYRVVIDSMHVCHLHHSPARQIVLSVQASMWDVKKKERKAFSRVVSLVQKSECNFCISNDMLLWHSA
jgi:hypothetical protein